MPNKTDYRDLPELVVKNKPEWVHFFKKNKKKIQDLKVQN